jgi:Undecaprenyl-phosphate glucose phosphotransferase
MLKERHQIFVGLFVLADCLALGLAWLASYMIRFELQIVPVTKGVPPLANYLILLPVIFVTWGLAFRSAGLYAPMRSSRRSHERRLVLRASSLAMLVFTAVSFLGFEKAYSLSRMTLVLFWLFATGAVILARSFLRGVLREARRQGRNLRHVLIVGDGELARSVNARLLAHPEFGLKVRGFLTEDRSKVGAFVGTTPILATWNDVLDIVDEGGVDQVIFALPFEAMPQLEGLVHPLEETAVDVKVIPDIERFVSLKSGIDELDGLPIIGLRAIRLVGWNRVLKRGMDIAASFLALLVLFPFMVLLAILIKLTSSGPIFFAQERMGLDGKLFRVWKFRTMKLNAEAETGPVWAKPNDPRSTLLGRGMRRLSIDELPQFWNVLCGEMSLVGPRPERPVFIREFRQHVPRYMLRHMVQAGMTGWAQVHGWRGDTSIERRIQYDLEYIQNWSMTLDLRILMLTVIRGFVNRNAY